MLPRRIVEFVNGPYFFGIGTRDQCLDPACSMVAGALADAERDLVTVLVPDSQRGPTLENLQANGRVAVLIGHDQGHETYQLKGSFVAARPCREEELAIRDIYLRKAEAFWYPEIGDSISAYLSFLARGEMTAITFRVEEIFDQTPGPGAGTPIDFEPASVAAGSDG